MLVAANNRKCELTAHQRSGQVTFWLLQGNKLTTVQIARLTGMTYQGAKYMMVMLEGVLPIVEIDGTWEWLKKEEV